MKKKVLIVSYVPTHPQDAGNNARVYNIIENMKNADVDIYFLFIQKNKIADLEKMKKYIGDKKLFIYKPKKDIKIGYIIRKLFRKILKCLKLSKKVIIYYKIDDIFPNQLLKFVRKLQKQYKFNVVWVEYVWYSKLLKIFDSNVIKVIDTHDVFTEREKLFLQKNEEPTWYYTTRKEETKGLQRADYVVAIQQQEANFFTEILNNNLSKVITIGNSIQTKKTYIVQNKKYVFIGSDNDLNIYALNSFIASTLILIKEKEPLSEFLIAGSVCKNIPDSYLYKKLGFVDDLQKIYNEVRAVINPIQSGTGLNIKTIEALSYEKPLITTQVGAKGLEDAEGAYIIADSSEEFADAVVEVLSDDNLAQKLSKEAHDYVYKYNRKNINNLLKILRV